jgi:xanthine dehydrogenase molybdopterin-binding subunit B
VTLDSPATPERVFFAIRHVRAGAEEAEIAGTISRGDR